MSAKKIPAEDRRVPVRIMMDPHLRAEVELMAEREAKRLSALVGGIPVSYSLSRLVEQALRDFLKKEVEAKPKR